MAWYQLLAGTHLEKGIVYKANDPGTNLLESNDNLVEIGGAAKFKRLDGPPEGYKSTAKPLVVPVAPPPSAPASAPSQSAPAAPPVPPNAAKESDLRKRT